MRQLLKIEVIMLLPLLCYSFLSRYKTCKLYANSMSHIGTKTELCTSRRAQQVCRVKATTIRTSSKEFKREATTRSTKDRMVEKASRRYSRLTLIDKL